SLPGDIALHGGERIECLEGGTHGSHKGAEAVPARDVAHGLDDLAAQPAGAMVWIDDGSQRGERGRPPVVPPHGHAALEDLGNVARQITPGPVAHERNAVPHRGERAGLVPQAELELAEVACEMAPQAARAVALVDEPGPGQGVKARKVRLKLRLLGEGSYGVS